MSIYSTSNMEQAIVLLASRYKRVLVKATYKMEKRIRIRPERFEPIHAYYQLISGADTQFQLWKEKGGVLVNFRDGPVYADYDAVIMIECPFDINELYYHAGTAKQVAVIFRPPTWVYHRAEMLRMNPASVTCRIVHDYIVSERGNKSDIKEGICNLLGSDPSTTALIEDQTLYKAVSMNNKEVSLIKNKLFRYSQKPLSFQTFRLRFEPDDMALMPTYKYLETEALNIDGLRIVNVVHFRRESAFHKKALNLLCRSGSVVRVSRISLYDVETINPKWDWIERRHKVFLLKLEAIINTVDNLPEFC